MDVCMHIDSENRQFVTPGAVIDALSSVPDLKDKLDLSKFIETDNHCKKFSYEEFERLMKEHDVDKVAEKYADAFYERCYPWICCLRGTMRGQRYGAV
jgi:hypothetical protein